MTLPSLHLIDLDQDLTGQREFISCWVSQSADLTFIVDPGPPATATTLLDRMQDLGVQHLDFILLTHVHLDHAGATAQILDRYPTAKVGCHPLGRPHLVDPAKLWNGSRLVLGEMATVYGEPQPVPSGLLVDASLLQQHGIRCMDTPGHASHHRSFLHAGTLFCGEVAGTYMALENGEYYLRPATPPRFILEPAQESLEILLALDPAPECLAFAHHGLVRERTNEVLTAARDQLQLWVNIARQEGGRGLPTFEALIEKIVTRLLNEDPYFAHLPLLAPDIQERERHFVTNSLDGILGYIDNKYRVGRRV